MAAMTMLPDVPKLETTIIEMTNQVRAEAKLGRVVASPQLTAAARAYAAVLARSKIFSHEADGTTMASRLDRAGYKGCMTAENLALRQSSKGFETRELAKSVVEGWLNSPGHRQNIMTGQMTEIGVAVARAADKDPKFLIVQLFGRPQSMAVEFQVSNSSSQTVQMAFGGKTTDIKPKLAMQMSSCAGGPMTLSAKGARGFEARYESVADRTYVISDPTGKGPLKVEAAERYRVR
jgi:hypothetical protein